MKIQRFVLGALALSAAGQAIGQQTVVPFAGRFGSGSILLSRVGDGTAALSGASTSVFLDEYRVVSGRGASAVVNYAQTLALDSTTAGSRQTNSGSATSELQLGYARDAGGTDYVFLGGYNAPAGTAGIAATTTPATPRVATRVSITGNTTYTNFSGDSTYSGNNIRSVNSTNGNDLLLAGAAGSGANGGVRSSTVGGANSTQISGAVVTNFRVVNSFNGNTYASSQSGTALGISQITGSGFTTLPGGAFAGTSLYDFFFAGTNTVYAADDRTSASGGLLRYDLNSGTGNWGLTYTINVPGLTAGTFAGLRGLTASFDGSEVDFYATSTDNRLIGITDFVSNTSAVGATVAPLASNPFQVGSASVNSAWRGVEIIPSPGSIALLGLGGLVAARRRRD